jgi:O-antigen/teichoic acid export membrane protein
MKLFKKIFKNTFWLISSEIISKVIGLIITILLAKYLGAGNFGKYSFVLAFVLIFGIITDFGFPTITVRDLARNKKLTRKYTDNIITIKLILSFITFLLIIGTIELFNKGSDVKLMVYLAGLWVIINSFTSFFTSIFRAYEKMKYESYSIIFERLILLIFIIIVVLKGLSLINLFQLKIISGLLGLVFVSLLIKKKFKGFWFKIDFKFWKHIIKESWPLALGIGFTAIYFYFDTIILSIFAKDEVVGWYNAAYKIIIFLIIGRRLFATAIYPSLSKYYIKSKVILKNIIESAEKISITFAIPLTMGGIILAEKIMLVVYGPEYINGTTAFQILMIQMLMLYINLLFTPFLHASNHQKTYMKIVGIGLITNILLNFLLIPKFYMIGAATATAISETFVLAFGYIYINKIIKIRISKFLIKPIISSIIMGTIIISLYKLNLFLLILIGVVTYSIILYLIKGISKDEIKTIKKLLINKKS